MPREIKALDVLKIVPAQDTPGEALLWCSNYIQYSLSEIPERANPAMMEKPEAGLSGVGNTTAHSMGKKSQNTTARYLELWDQNMLVSTV